MWPLPLIASQVTHGSGARWPPFVTVLTVKYSSAYCSAEAPSARGSLQDVVLCSLGDSAVLHSLDDPRGLGQVTAIRAMRELFLGTALETRGYSIASLERVNKHHALGKIIISWMKKGKKKSPSSYCRNTRVYFYSKLLFVNTVVYTLGMLFPQCTFHLGKEKNLNQTVYLGVATLPPCWPNLPCRLRKTAKGQVGCQTAILYNLMPTTAWVQLWGTLHYVKYTLTQSK